MKVTYQITFRHFNDKDEKNDSGYYDGLSSKRKAQISVNRGDDTLEQVLTVYHEITHALLELVLLYKLDPKNKSIKAQRPELKEAWDKHEAPTEEEEKICRAIEAQVKKILRKKIPTDLYTQMFEQSKRFVLPKNKKKRH